MDKKSVLLKLSGELFATNNNNFDLSLISSLITGIKEVLKNFNLGIVIGGGNFFRGSKEGKDLGLKESVAHEIGMLATIMNGKILQQLLEKEDIKTTLFSALQCNPIAKTINQNNIDRAFKENHCLIFSGGTGNPFFTTDTNAILRALQINAQEVWKATNVDGLYNSDPKINPNAKLIKKTTYGEILQKKLNVMDLTAISLAQQYNIKIKIFNIFKKDSLFNLYKNSEFGSLVEGN